MMKNDGGPAFPCEVDPERLESGAHQTGSRIFQQYGMSLRDHFAGLALQAGINSVSDLDCDDIFAQARALAREAYIYADAMLAERQSEPTADPASPPDPTPSDCSK